MAGQAGNSDDQVAESYAAFRQRCVACGIGVAGGMRRRGRGHQHPGACSGSKPDTVAYAIADPQPDANANANSQPDANADTHSDFDQLRSAPVADAGHVVQRSGVSKLSA